MNHSSERLVSTHTNRGAADVVGFNTLRLQMPALLPDKVRLSKPTPERGRSWS